MAVGSDAKGLYRRVGAHGVFGGLCTLEQKVEQTIQIGVRLWR